MDIILGLPDEKIYNVLVTLFNLYKLKPDSLTIHSLALKRAARLNNEIDFWAKDHYLAGLSDSKSTEGKRTIDKMYAYSKKLTEILKMKPYYLYRQKNMAGNLENIGYANEGKECIYNIMMMSERHTVYGFGTATTKKVFYEKDGKRIENELGYKSVIDYCKSEKMWYNLLEPFIVHTNGKKNQYGNIFSGGPDCDDKIFILSAEEAKRYFGYGDDNNSKRIAVNTGFVNADYSLDNT